MDTQIQLLLLVLASTENTLLPLPPDSRGNRETALMQRYLWTEIKIELDSIITAALWHDILLHAYISRSGPLPLNITLISRYTYGIDEIGDVIFSTLLDEIIQQLAICSHRWESLHLNLGQSIMDTTSHCIEQMLSTQMDTLQKFTAHNLFVSWGSVLQQAPNLRRVSLVDPIIDTTGFFTPTVTHLSFEYDGNDTAPITEMIEAASNTLAELSFSVFGWNQGARIRGRFPHLVTLVMKGSTMLEPGLFLEFEAPALRDLTINLWRVEDMREFLDCTGIPFSLIKKLSLGWTATDHVNLMHQCLLDLSKRCISLELFKVDPSASPQCDRTCMLVLLARLGDTNGLPFSYSSGALWGHVSTGEARLSMQESLIRRFDLPDITDELGMYLATLHDQV